jgi:hypothetical protein
MNDLYGVVSSQRTLFNEIIGTTAAVNKETGSVQDAKAMGWLDAVMKL